MVNKYLVGIVIIIFWEILVNIRLWLYLVGEIVDFCNVIFKDELKL